MKYFVIFFVITLSVSVMQVYAIPILNTVEDLEKLSKYTIKGTVIDIRPIMSNENSAASDNQRRMMTEISIKAKNELQDQYVNNTIKFRVISYTTITPIPKSIDNSRTFQIGESVTVFLTNKEPESDFTNSYAGFVASKYVVADGIAYEVTSTKQSSPLQQHKSGTPSRDVNCNDGLRLVIKTSDGNPACVKQSSLIPLMILGWTKTSNFEITDGFFEHKIENGKITSMKADLEQCESIKLQIQPQDDGKLIISIPKKIFDLKTTDRSDLDFLVFINGMEIVYKKTEDEMQTTFTIEFDKNADTIEIAKTCLI